MRMAVAIICGLSIDRTNSGLLIICRSMGLAAIICCSAGLEATMLSRTPGVDIIELIISSIAGLSDSWGGRGRRGVRVSMKLGAQW
jgi:hypothetical protein